jgi:pyruvate/2-oxoglutarate dehydrogenase complex dihydrolipoamide dehydrogenase (E3) component
VGRRGKVLGATIVGRNAGELILPWVLSIGQGLGMAAYGWRHCTVSDAERGL